ncbi:RICIN domain-containing protein [Paenibacillus sp. 1P07SE]|uniref:RICIN domain-containing protein n=1 Tax=Paenibacillus sp. 1P07SE TaxID=3132209 RepID=UPI0039A41AFD
MSRGIKASWAGLLAVLLLLQGWLPAAASAETMSPQNVPEAPKAGSWCYPYGPKPGYRYDPKKLMKLMGEPRDQSRGPFLSAHRGAWGNDIPENSIMAINRAAELKFEMVELDVKMTQDGQLILMHDYTYGRTTNFAEDVYDSFNWDPFLAQTYYHERPQDDGNWTALGYYNPVISDVSWEGQHRPTLRAFDKSKGDLGEITGAHAIGRWVEDKTFGPPPTLLEALQHIGTYYPGMTAVIDLRHLDEVIETMNVVDQVFSCDGKPASEWVILKPFANVFPGGWYNAAGSDQTPAAGSVHALIGARAQQYKWIPVVSNRLVQGNQPGSPSIIPTSPGPDISQITDDVQGYLEDWGIHRPEPSWPVVTMEIGIGSQQPSPLKTAYDWATQYATNMQSWRPPDIDVKAPVPDPYRPGYTIIGFNWKDDGLGAYPIHQELVRSYADVRLTAGVMTVDDTANVLSLWEPAGQREAAMMAIAEPLPLSRYSHYRITAKHSGKSLIIPNNDQAPGVQATVHAGKGDNQRWRFEGLGGGHYRLISILSGKVLDVQNGGSAENTPVLQWTWSNSDNQRWLVERTNDGYYRIVSVENERVLQVQDGNQGNGAAITVGAWTNHPRQKWELLSGGFGTTLVRNVNSGKVLDVPASTMENTPLIQWEKSDDFNQRFGLETQATGYRFHALHSSKVLDVEGGSDKVVQWGSTYEDSQYWRAEPLNDGTYRIVNAASGGVLDVAGASQDNHAPVIAHSWNGYANQRWYVEPLFWFD